jgi:hypothetical protein
MKMKTQAQGIGEVLEQTFARLQVIAALILFPGLLTAVVTDGSVPALATKALLAAMVLPTVVLSVGLTRPSDPSAPATC